jgi:hypothetical protein
LDVPFRRPSRPNASGFYLLMRQTWLERLTAAEIFYSRFKSQRSPSVESIVVVSQTARHGRGR